MKILPLLQPSVGWLLYFCLVAPSVLQGQIQALPTTSERPTFSGPRASLQPGGYWEIYGSNLGPDFGCGIASKPPYPTEVCGVRATIGARPAGLMYVGPRQVNVQVPRDIPDGSLPVVLCFREVCSEPALVRVNAHTAFIRVEDPIYLHMPIWIQVEMPAPYQLSYGCLMNPWGFSAGNPFGTSISYEFELKRNGALIEPKRRPEIPNVGWQLKTGGCRGGSSGSGPYRLPLHLLYGIDLPGIYSLRLIGRSGSNIVVQSGWTDMEVKPASPAVHDAWLSSVAKRLRSAGLGTILQDIIPSLLASPDERALRLLKPVYSNLLGSRRRFRNRDIYVYGFLRNTLAAFPDAVLRHVYSPRDLAQMCPPQGRCEEISW